MSARILIDLDDTCTTMIEPLVTLYNKKYNDNLTKDSFPNYSLDDVLKKECKNIFAEFVNDNFFENIVEFYPNAIDSLNNLMKYCEVYFVTAGHPITLLARHKLLEKNLKYYTRDNLVSCVNKSIIDGDIIIDDCLNNIRNSDCEYKIVMEQSWNRNVKLKSNEVMFNNWIEIMNYLHKLVYFPRVDF